MGTRKTILTVATGLTLWTGHVLSEGGPPELDIESTCKSSGRTQVGMTEEESQDGCLRSERAAHDELKKRWGEFSPEAKAQCSKQAIAGGFPSYVETVTCLELATGTVPAQTGNDLPAATEPKTSKRASPDRSGDSTLTTEPPAKQRTNPIEVLEKKP